MPPLAFVPCCCTRSCPAAAVLLALGGHGTWAEFVLAFCVGLMLLCFRMVVMMDCGGPHGLKFVHCLQRPWAFDAGMNLRCRSQCTTLCTKRTACPGS
eukprot:1158076-Pelagomonas_calceolata.AAC.14